jgi:hypothetical protein
VCNSRDAIPLKFSDYVIKAVLGTGAVFVSLLELEPEPKNTIKF